MREDTGERRTPERRHLFDDPRNVQWVIRALAAACLLVLAADFLVDRDADHPWESLFAFYALYGFVACVLLVLIAKALRKILMRPEDYYDD
ncbi:MAG: hypothetical protein WD044_00995 [Dongiaceae bacterium]